METNNKFKLFLPGITSDNNDNVSLIAADLRDGITLIGHYGAENKKVFLKTEKSYSTKEYSSFSEMVNLFISEHSLENISKIAVAVPGPVIGGKSAPQRLPWKLDAEDIKNDTQANEVYLINDLEASAYGLENMAESDLLVIHDSGNFTPGNAVILSPGVGLGEAALFWDGSYLRPFATEGGHCEFSPRTNDEVEFYSFLQKIYGIVSWESVLSTAGLFNVYRFLRDVKRQVQPDWLTQEIEAGNFTEAIIRGAVEKRDRICTMTIETFLIFLAREANSLVLKMKATGGLFLSGEILIMLEEFLNNKKFYKNFIISDKMENILKDIPIYLVKDEKTIINGAALYAAFYKKC
ncbi:MULTISPECIES: glucokinase [unclassified Kaistella]|uniref:glucokinase n=1 Tax=unclassified Kaistella TaxID=2762626 RepID=UPI0027359471|nr:MULTISPECIES: glucokinase [unclassified Kaistella]MDP2454071.1 glucokinase [Kaistella sp. SH11-4b]MDP2457128.1 glucokinase [Kaistella sp. SH40-3]MDP2459886.1 glucokinase [Kaistella sp. SH19-2b]